MPLLTLLIGIAAVVFSAALDAWISYRGSRQQVAIEGFARNRVPGKLIFSVRRYAKWDVLFFSPFLAVGILCLRYGNAAEIPWAACCCGPFVAAHLIQVSEWRRLGARF